MPCIFCGSPNHLVCPLIASDQVLIKDYISDLEELSKNSDDGEENKEKEITKSNENLEKTELNNFKEKSKQTKSPVINEKNIKYTNFCSKCAGNHLNIDCDLKSKENFFDKRREIVKNSIQRQSESRNNNKNKDVNNIFTYIDEDYSSNDGYPSNKRRKRYRDDDEYDNYKSPKKQIKQKYIQFEQW